MLLMQMYVCMYVCIGLSVFLFTATEYVLFLPVGLLFIKNNLLTCIWTQISIFHELPRCVVTLCAELHTTIQLLQYAVYTVNSMLIFCVHGIIRLPATFGEIWCMHLNTLRGKLFPRTQGTPCDISSSNAWVNWRWGIVFINVHNYIK